jgi:hypothetical protein
MSFTSSSAGVGVNLLDETSRACSPYPGRDVEERSRDRAQRTIKRKVLGDRERARDRPYGEHRAAVGGPSGEA